ncbi:MAG: DUF4386 family protein [Actinomycetota bacterium]
MSTRRIGVLVIVESVLIFVPLIVLGVAINWPASLDDPAAVALPRLSENEAAVRAGYLVYLGYSILFLPVALAITRWTQGTGRSALSTAALVAIGFATLSSGMRTIGILRWLSTMFPLAERWDQADAAEQTAIAVQFDALNAYGGAIGEVLGVSLFAALWVAVTALAPGRADLPWWFRPTGALVAVIVALPVIDLVGVDPGMLTTVGGTAIHLWLLAIGLTMLRSQQPATRAMAVAGGAPRP